MMEDLDKKIDDVAKSTLAAFLIHRQRIKDTQIELEKLRVMVEGLKTDFEQIKEKKDEKIRPWWGF